MPSVTVRHQQADQFSIVIGTHTLTVDQPTEAGGAGSAPTPTELFVASLAACVAHYARRYLARHDLSTQGLEVTASFEMANSPARVGQVIIHITLPDDFPEERRQALLAVASHCTVHNTLNNPPTVEVTLTPEPVLSP
jgi:putative redox protein